MHIIEHARVTRVIVVARHKRKKVREGEVGVLGEVRHSKAACTGVKALGTHTWSVELNTHGQ